MRNVLVLGSTSRNFPISFTEALLKEGYDAEHASSLAEFIASPKRTAPFLGILEIGCVEDIDRALIAYEWSESVQPTVAVRYLLLIANKNISLGDRVHRFGNAELAQLPLPLRNLFFKVDLQLRVLSSGRAAVSSTEPTGFSVQYELQPRRKQRVLVMRGPSPRKGGWQSAGEGPQGKIRWRWVTAEAERKAEENTKVNLSWIAETKSQPKFDEDQKIWTMDEPADVVCYQGEEEVFRATKSQPFAKDGPESVSFGQEKSEAPKERQALAANTPEGPKASGGGSREPPKPASENREFAPKKAAEPVASSSQQKPEAGKSPNWSFKQREEKTRSISEKDSAPEEARSSQKARMNAEEPESRKKVAEAHTTPESTEPSERSFKDKKKPAGDRPKKEVSVAETQKPETEPTEGRSVGVSSFSEKDIHAGTQAAPTVHSSRLEKEIHDTPATPPLATKAEQAKGRTNLSSGEEAAAKERERKALREEKKSAGKIERDRPEDVAEAQEKSQQALEREDRAEAAFPKEKSGKPGGPGDFWGEASPASAGSAAEKSQTVEEATASSQGAAGIIVPSGEKEGRIVLPSSNQGQDQRPESQRVAGQLERAEVQVLSAGGRETDSEGNRYLSTRFFVTLTLVELNDRNSSWQPVDRYRLYLAADHRYFGVKTSDSIFPLWVYEGELAPEFLDVQKAWKFYDRPPEAHHTFATLPGVTRAYAEQLCGILPEANAEKTVDEKTKAQSKEGRKPVVVSVASPEQMNYGLWQNFLSFLSRIFGR